MILTPSAIHRRLRAAATVAAILTAPCVPTWAAAQAVEQMPRWPATAETAACFDRIPRQAYGRVLVYGTAVWADSASGTPPNPALLAAADALLQRVGERARSMLRPAGATGDSVPPGEPELGDSLHVWRGVGGRVEVTAYRDGHVAWTVDSLWRGDSTAATLLSRALAAVQAGDEAAFLWPADTTLARLGQVRFDFTFLWPSKDSHGIVIAPSVTRPVEPLFAMLEPWTDPVRVARSARPSYPKRQRDAGFEGSILLQYVVDTSGRARPETIHAVWRPGTRPLLDQQQFEAYHAFVDASRRSAVDTRYEPARVGGCAISQIVQQPFGYVLDR